MPKLKGKTITAATRALKAARCKLGKVTKRPSKRHSTSIVVKQGAKPGTKLPAGAPIDVKLARKPTTGKRHTPRHG